jgi:uncharacterized protein YutD
MKSLTLKLKNIFRRKNAINTELSEAISMNLEDFFKQNCEGIIGCNVEPEIPLDVFYSSLQKIESDKRTSKIQVRISDVEDNCKFSDAIYILGNWTKKELEKEIKHLSPDEIYEGFLYEKPKRIKVDEGEKIFTIWWD